VEVVVLEVYLALRRLGVTHLVKDSTAFVSIISVTNFGITAAAQDSHEVVASKQASLIPFGQLVEHRPHSVVVEMAAMKVSNCRQWSAEDDTSDIIPYLL
jgi:hypothetical protein